MKKKIGLLAAGLLAVTVSLFVAASPSSAEVKPDCKSVTFEVADRPDNGHGTPATWALDTMKRTVEVCRVMPQQPSSSAAAEADIASKSQTYTWNYTAKLTDSGTFVTKGSATGSPNAGANLTAGVKGTVLGEATFAKFSSTAYWKDWQGGVYDKKKFTGDKPGTTGDSVKMLFEHGVTTKITAYKWTYKTCSEQWVDSSEESNGDGTSDSAGDITGKACPSPTPSPSTPMPSTTITGQPTLPVTGSTPFLFGIAAAALAAGAVLVVFARRRRVKFTP